MSDWASVPVTDVSRGLIHGGLQSTDLVWVLVWSAGLLAVFAPLTMRLYNSER